MSREAFIIQGFNGGNPITDGPITIDPHFEWIESWSYQEERNERSKFPSANVELQRTVALYFATREVIEHEINKAKLPQKAVIAVLE